MAAPVPAIPILKRTVPHRIGITGTRPVMSSVVKVLQIA
jgi:hypothetical protein